LKPRRFDYLGSELRIAINDRNLQRRLTGDVADGAG
jgi:hypothetical protein